MLFQSSACFPSSALSNMLPSSSFIKSAQRWGTLGGAYRGGSAQRKPRRCRTHQPRSGMLGRRGLDRLIWQIPFRSITQSRLRQALLLLIYFCFFILLFCALLIHLCSYDFPLQTAPGAFSLPPPLHCQIDFSPRVEGLHKNWPALIGPEPGHMVKWRSVIGGNPLGSWAQAASGLVSHSTWPV